MQTLESDNRPTEERGNPTPSSLTDGISRVYRGAWIAARKLTSNRQLRIDLVEGVVDSYVGFLSRGGEVDAGAELKWAEVVAKNLVQTLRKARSREVVSSLLIGDSAADSSESSSRLHEAHGRLAELDEKAEKILTRRQLEVYQAVRSGASIKEAARSLEMIPINVRKTMRAIAVKFRKHLESE